MFEKRAYINKKRLVLHQPSYIIIQFYNHTLLPYLVLNFHILSLRMASMKGLLFVQMALKKTFPAILQFLVDHNRERRISFFLKHNEHFQTFSESLHVLNYKAKIIKLCLSLNIFYPLNPSFTSF